MPRSILTRARILVGVAGGRRPVRRARAGLALLALVVVPLAGGCRGGVRSLAAPKWPTFGAGKAPAAADLAAAPAAAPAAGPIQKPASAASPYPTSTAGGDSATAAMNQGVVQTAGIDPPVVTYGVTPPPAALDAAPPAPMESVAAAPIAPQVGRYSELPSPPPPAGAPVAAGIPPAARAEETLASAAPAAAAAGFPATAGYEPAGAPAPDRFGAPAAPPLVPVAPPTALPAAAPPSAALSAAPAAPPAMTAAEAGAAVGVAAGVPARYASQGSRFGGDPAPTGTIPNASLPPDPAPFPTADALPPAAATSAFATAPAPLEPPAPPADLPAAPAPEAPAMLPAGTPDGLTTPPVRRRDPVYRPGNTSSYRPAEQVFADEPATVPSPVRTASFDVVDPPPLPSSPVLR